MGDSDPDISVATTPEIPPAPPPAPSEILDQQPAPKPQLSEGQFADAYQAMAAGDYDTAARISGVDAGKLKANAQRVLTSQDGDRLALSMNLGHDVDSSRAARIYEAAAKTGLPFKAVDGDLEGVESATSQADFDPYKFRTQSPIVAQMAQSNPTVAAMMRPDMDKLGILEGIYQSFRGGAYQTLYAQQVGQARGALLEGWRDTQSEEKLREVKALIDQSPTGAAHGISGMLDSLAAFGGSIGAKIRAAAGNNQSYDPTPQTGWIRDDRVRGLGAAYVGQAWLDSENYRDKNGNQLDPTTRWNLANAVAGINMLGDVAGIAPGAGGAIGRGVGFAGKWGAMRLLSQSALDAAKDPTIRSRLLAYTGQTGLSLVDLAGFGAAQAGADTLATKLAEIHDQEVNARDFGTTLGSSSRDILESGWHGALDQLETMGLPTVLGHAVGAAVDSYQLRRAMQTAQAVRDAGNTIAQTQLPQHALTYLAANLSTHYGVPTTFIPPEDWRDYWRGEGQDPGLAATAVLGNKSIEYESALAEQRHMEIPTETYMATIVKTKHNNFFSTVLTHDRDALNERQAVIQQVLEPGGYAEEHPGGMTADQAVAEQNAAAGITPDQTENWADREAATAQPDRQEEARLGQEKQAAGQLLAESMVSRAEAQEKFDQEYADALQKREKSERSAGEGLARAMTAKAEMMGIGHAFNYDPETKAITPFLTDEGPQVREAPKEDLASVRAERHRRWNLARWYDKQRLWTGDEPMTNDEREFQAADKAVTDAQQKYEAAKSEPHPVRQIAPRSLDYKTAADLFQSAQEAKPPVIQPRDPLDELRHGLYSDLEERVRTGNMGIPADQLPLTHQVVRAFAQHMKNIGAIADTKQITYIIDHLTEGESSRQDALRVLREAMQLSAGQHIVNGVEVKTGDVPEGVRVGPEGVTISNKIPRFQEINGALVDVHHEIAEHETGGKESGPDDEFTEQIQPLIDKATAKEVSEAPAANGEVKVFGHGPGVVDKVKDALAKSMVGQKAAEALMPVVQEAEAVRAALAPQTAGDKARYGSGLLRETLAQRARAADVIDHFLESSRRALMRFSVEDNRDFIDRMETGRAQRTPELQKISDTLRDIDTKDRKDVQDLGEGKLEHWIENHFPHRYTQNSLDLLARKPLEQKGFMKERKIPTLKEAVDKHGLEPISNNPVDFIRMQHREMQGYVYMVKMRQELAERGLLPFVPIGARGPETHVRVDDPSLTAYGAPVHTASEYVDANVYQRLSNLAAKLGIPHERLASAGRGRLGYSITGGGMDKIVTRYGTTMAVMAHELGHQLDAKYGLINALLTGRKAKHEARLIMATHIPEGMTAGDMGPKWRRWSKMPEERVASTIELYTHNRSKLRDMAPTIAARFDAFVDAHPELDDLRKAVPSLATKKLETDLPHFGMNVLGHYWVPKEMAPILNNYLSSGLRKSVTYRAALKANNLLTAFQLGASGFHFAFTSVDSAASQMALALQHTMDGNVGKAISTAASTPFAPGMNFLTGRRIRQEWEIPGSTDDQTRKIVDALVAAGARIKQDDFLRPGLVQKFTDAFHAGNVAAMATHAPLALIAATHHILMDHWVPQLKLGVAAQMVQRELERNPGMDRDQLREVMGRVWDSVDNRMGQMVYDNLHWNKTIKDSMQLGVRALGWNLGTWRELGGGVADFAGTAKDLKNGTWNGLTHRQAYVLAMPVMVAAMGSAIQYMFTGTTPQDLRDYFFPKIGGKDANGDDNRVGLPSYMKDVFEAMHDPYDTATNKLSPMFGMAADMLNNKDYYGTEIRNKDDPLVQQALEVAKYAGKQFEPFSLSNLGRAGVGGFIGFPQAPWFIRATPAEQKAQELAGDQRPQGGRTQEQADKSAVERDLVLRLRDPNQQGQAVQDMIHGYQTGELTRNDLENIHERTLKPRLDYEVTHLNTDDGMKVWEQANPQERRRIEPILLKKIRDSRSLDPATRRRYLSELSTGQ